jgi:GMP synthase PP-ATPase subunit
LIPKSLGYKILEPLIELRKMAYARLERDWACPPACSTVSLSGPALAARVIGEVTPQESHWSEKHKHHEAALKDVRLFSIWPFCMKTG